MLVETFQRRKRVSNLETPIVREVSQPVLHLVIAKILLVATLNLDTFRLTWLLSAFLFTNKRRCAYRPSKPHLTTYQEISP